MEGERSEVGDIKAIKMCYVYAQSAYDKCDHFVMETFPSKTS